MVCWARVPVWARGKVDGPGGAAAPAGTVTLPSAVASPRAVTSEAPGASTAGCVSGLRRALDHGRELDDVSVLGLRRELDDRRVLVLRHALDGRRGRGFVRRALARSWRAFVRFWRALRPDARVAPPDRSDVLRVARHHVDDVGSHDHDEPAGALRAAATLGAHAQR